MGAQAAFNADLFAASYPEFNQVPVAFISARFTMAGIYHRNDGSGPVQDPNVQLMLMNMVTAHIVKLEWRGNNAQISQGPELVGALTSASEGSVSVSTNEQAAPGSDQWFKQTTYGNGYLTATAGWRLGRYAPKRGRPMGPFWLGRGYY